MAVLRSPFLMFFYRLDLVFYSPYNYTICEKRNVSVTQPYKRGRSPNDIPLPDRREQGLYRLCRLQGEMHSYISTFTDRGVIAFWDGSSRGTAQSFALSKEFDNPLRVIRINSSHRPSVS